MEATNEDITRPELNDALTAGFASDTGPSTHISFNFPLIHRVVIIGLRRHATGQ